MTATRTANVVTRLLIFHGGTLFEVRNGPTVVALGELESRRGVGWPMLRRFRRFDTPTIKRRAGRS